MTVAGLSKSCSSLNKMFKHKKIVVCFLLYLNLYFLNAKAQVANYIANGSFEEYYDCNVPHALRKVKSWLSIDSISYGGQHVSTCYNTVPLFGNSYQYPKSGNSYVICTIFNSGQGRGYLKNRLKQNLKLGKTYCVKFYINISDYSTYGIDGFGIFFGDNNIDTITNCNTPLTYIIPQVKNPLGNLISDTLNWVSITGTFVANGSEKYALIGNFILDGALTSTLINSSFLPLVFSDVNFDDVSCMDVDLPAFAGNDTVCVPGTSVYIGRPRDVGIDEACSWYQLPNTTSVIATAAGNWVSPVTTSTYIVRQEICGNIKWDTVVVVATGLGLFEGDEPDTRFKIYPQPAKDELLLEIEGSSTSLFQLKLYNNLGVLLREEELNFTNQKALINISDLANGVYALSLKTSKNEWYKKRLVVQK